jgi:hypothetical protein
MSAFKKLSPISVEDYLAGELVSPVKHEYLGGVVYAMAGARNAHNLIAGNVLIALGGRLRGRPCRPYNSDTKIRIRLPHHVRFLRWRGISTGNDRRNAATLVREPTPDEAGNTSDGSRLIFIELTGQKNETQHGQGSVLCEVG